MSRALLVMEFVEVMMSQSFRFAFTLKCEDVSSHRKRQDARVRTVLHRALVLYPALATFQL